MRWKEGNYSNDNVVIDDLTNGADLVCRAPDSRTTPDSYANWERNRRIIIQAPAMLDMLKRVVQAADGGPVIQASEIEALIAAAEPPREEVQDVIPLTVSDPPAGRPPLDYGNRAQIRFQPETVFGYSPQAHASLEAARFWPYLPNGGRLTEQEFRQEGARVGRFITGMSITASSSEQVDMTFSLRDGRRFAIPCISPEFHFLRPRYLLDTANFINLSTPVRKHHEQHHPRRSQPNLGCSPLAS